MKINKDSTEIEESVWDYKMSDVVIVAILGVIGTLIGSVIGLLCGTITESKRAENERRLHSQRVRFDYEFNLYQILAEKHLTMVYDIGTAVVISRGGEYLNINTNKDFISLATQHISEADIQNKRSAPFISKDIFEAYKELGKLSFKAVSIFDIYCKFEELNVSTINYNGKQYTKAESKKELENLQKEISSMSDKVLDQVRIYITEKSSK